MCTKKRKSELAEEKVVICISFQVKIIISIDNGRNSRDPTRHSKDGQHFQLHSTLLFGRKLVSIIIAKTHTQLTTIETKKKKKIERITGERERETSTHNFVERRRGGG